MEFKQLLKLVEEFDRKFPRKTIPSYIKASRDIWEQCKKHFPMVVHGHPTFNGLDVYVDDSLPKGTYKIYNLDHEVIDFKASLHGKIRA